VSDTRRNKAAQPEMLRVVLLGRFEVSVGPRVVGEEGWRLRKAAGLVKLLALTPEHRLHRDQAMDKLWPDLPPRAAANNLYQALHVARRTLGPGASPPRYLQLRGERILLNPEGRIWVDVIAFERAAALARRSREASAYESALDIYAGELLPTDRYEDWADDRRRELRDVYLALLVEVGHLYEKDGKLQLAIEALSRVVAVEPTHEEAHVGLMRLYAAAGRRFDALRQHERLREVLDKELGIEPGPGSRRVLAEIVAGHSPVGDTPRPEVRAGSGPNNIPASLTSFVGRRHERSEVEGLLRSARLLTLTGIGGCGKTRLALEVAGGLASAYPDGVRLVELAPLSEAALVPQAVADALGVREEPGRKVEATLVDAAAGKRMLILLDNCEHLVDAAASLAETLLAACPELRILATSRELLGARGEVVFTVAPFPGPALGCTVEELECHDAARLFVERARSRDPGFALTPTNARAVAEICSRLDGIPLAIELAAARVGLSVTEVSARLDDSLGFLTTGARTATPRQRTLRGALDWSHDLLTVPERKLFRRLSVFAGGWTLDAVEAVTSDGGIERGRVPALFGALADKSLVAAAQAPGAGARFRLLEPVRQYAREELEGAGEEGALRRRHALYYLELAEEAGPRLLGPDQVSWMERLEADHDNLRAVLAWALEVGETGIGQRLGASLGEFWRVRGHLQEGRRWLEATLAADEGPSPARARVLAHAAQMAWERGDFERSVTLGGECLELSRQLEDPAGVAFALFNLGSVALFRREYAQSARLFEEAAALWRGLGDTVNLARTLHALGLIAAARHDFDRARALHEESLALARRTDDGMGVSLTLGLGALAALGHRDHALARTLIGEGLEQAGRVGHAHALAFHLHLAAALAGARGNASRSARLWGAAEALREEIGVPFTPVEQHHFGPYILAARERIGEAAWQSAWAAGRSMTSQEAAEFALEDPRTESR
jgi:predicted ATPase/DNA-binding SARP family transcriptional activator